MTTAHRDFYAQKALSQIPRLLGNLDRNPFSPTYGCFHRDYWLDKTSDFPDAVRQFAVHALALVYKHNFPGSIYKGQPKIRDWAIAGLDFWARMQHADGSFDEFYPFERGWVGPTAFTTFTSIEACNLLRDELPDDVAGRVREAVRRAAYFIAAGESEEDHLANHHAMACLAVWKAYLLLGEPELKVGFQRLWQGFLSYHNFDEGWSREYDGVDPGYLSATVSFFGKIYQTHPDPEILRVLKQSVEFAAYFAYPNGFYAGSMGSRNTLHFYPHGFEILSNQIPLAAAVADKMLAGLGEDKLVPPEIISDRYVVYRIPEFLQAYLDYQERPARLVPLPCQRESFQRYFPQSRIFVANTPENYVIANLAKGGVVKIFNRQSGQLMLNDCGVIGQLDDGRIVTSQWVDPSYVCIANETGWMVSGQMNLVPSNKLFTPLKNILFRGVLVALGWNTDFSHYLKGSIRKTLILGQRAAPLQFQRSFRFEGGKISLTDELNLEANAQLADLSVGDEFFVRYVPQSRYFQSQELDVSPVKFSGDLAALLNQNRRMRISQTLDTASAAIDVEVMVPRIAQTYAEQQSIYWESQRKRRHPSDPIVAAFAQPKLNFVLKHIELPSAPLILDVGCGNGYFTHYLQNLGKTIGLDYATGMLRQNPADDLLQASAFNLPYPAGTFDVSFCSNLLHHMTNPVEAIKEMNRVSNRYVVISEPNRNNPAILALGLTKPEERESLRFTSAYLRSLAEQAGLQVLACETMGFVTPNRMPRPVVDLVSRFNKPNPLGAYTVLVAQCNG